MKNEISLRVHNVLKSSLEHMSECDETSFNLIFNYEFSYSPMCLIVEGYMKIVLECEWGTLQPSNSSFECSNVWPFLYRRFEYICDSCTILTITPFNPSFNYEIRLLCVRYIALNYNILRDSIPPSMDHFISAIYHLITLLFLYKTLDLLFGHILLMRFSPSLPLIHRRMVSFSHFTMPSHFSDRWKIMPTEVKTVSHFPHSQFRLRFLIVSHVQDSMRFDEVLRGSSYISPSLRPSLSSVCHTLCDDGASSSCECIILSHQFPLLLFTHIALGRSKILGDLIVFRAPSSARGIETNPRLISIETHARQNIFLASFPWPWATSCKSFFDFFNSCSYLCEIVVDCMMIFKVLTIPHFPHPFPPHWSHFL